ncbi:hypothetical protein [Microbacterium sp. AG238]|uniref:hypothetical protein n=1 Tax=Microbacterium sp. AG238 TaxID=2183994 RepID=UPI000E7121CA|nr:hypothetical protein [Microbacterium sp. AG238]RKE60510.1 hypothetical protein DEU36_2953 [Microbacterium sp. AG238]
MKLNAFPTRGRPSKDIVQGLEEVVMLTQAALSIVNTQRRVLDRDALQLGVGLRPSKRDAAYEVTVVDQFYQLGQRHFERRNISAMWERPFLTGQRGRPTAVDISLFYEGKGREVRVEFGRYTKEKLRSDAKKLNALTTQVEPGYGNVVNHLVLWEERATSLTRIALLAQLERFRRQATEVSSPTMLVEVLMASSVDLFAEQHDQHRVIDVGLFKVTPR